MHRTTSGCERIVGGTRPKLRVLFIEDSELDAEVLLRELALAHDVIHERVDSAAALEDALARGWDLILSDFAMPSFDARRALAIVQSRGVDIPFIIVSGAVDEATAVASMRAGAHDFIAKGRLARLLPAIDRELREAKVRAERKTMHEQLLVADRMVSIGTLAAGVAHEINNPLAAVLANVNVVRHTLADGLARPTDLVQRVEDASRILEETHEALLRVCEVSRDLKVFSRGNEGGGTAVDVRRVLESSLRIARNEIRHRATVVRDYEDVPAVLANETRLGQVFLNLLVNAAQAIPEGDALRQQIRVTTRRDGADGVLVAVQDTGPGIAPEVLPHIFEPFYSTKAIGVGTGLGLAICRRIVTELGGEIRVEARRDAGTTFSVRLPAAQLDLAVAPMPIVPRPSPIRRAKVLVIDDDEHVLNATVRALAIHHAVMSVTSAREVLQRVTRGEWFDVIVCDLLMPNTTGMAFYDALVALAPRQADRVAFITGGAFTPAASAFLETNRQPRLDKPFEIATLLEVIAELSGTRA